MTSKPAWRAIHWAGFALVTSISLVILKFIAFAITGSSAILSDAVESLINIVTSGFAFFAVWLSGQPRDREHPYGHGKIEYLSAGLEGILVVVAGIAILGISIYRTVHPPVLEDLDLGAGLTLFAALFAAGAGMLLIRAGRQHESQSLEADGVHLRTDAVTSFGAAFGVMMVKLTGWIWLDALLAGALSLWLLYEGVQVVRRAVGGILDEASPQLLDTIAEVLERERKPGWMVPHHTKVHRLGQTIHIDLHIVFPRFWSIEETHAETEALEQAIRERFGEKSEIMVHMEACRPDGCISCDLTDCPVRSSPFAGRETWSGESISKRYRHHDRSDDSMSPVKLIASQDE